MRNFISTASLYECRWPWRYFKAIKLFHIQFLVNGALYGRSYYKVLIGNHTLAFDWWNFWWPWSAFEGHFSLVCHFHIHFSNPWSWLAFALRGLPATAELLVVQLISLVSTNVISSLNEMCYKSMWCFYFKITLVVSSTCFNFYNFFVNIISTRTATRSCRNPETAVIHFWSPGGVRRRPQRVASAALLLRPLSRPPSLPRPLLLPPPVLLRVLLYSQFGD